MPKPKGNTPPVQFRLSPEALAQIDELAEYLSIPSRTAVVRLAVARMYRKELPESARKKSGKKSA